MPPRRVLFSTALSRLAPAAVASQSIIGLIQEVAPGEYGAIVAMLHTMPLVIALLAHESPVAAVIATLTASGIRIFLQALITYMRAAREYIASDRTAADKRALRRALLDFTTPAWAADDTKRLVALHASGVVNREAAIHRQKIWWQRVRGDPPQMPAGARRVPRKRAK